MTGRNILCWFLLCKPKTFRSARCHFYIHDLLVISVSLALQSHIEIVSTPLDKTSQTDITKHYFYSIKISIIIRLLVYVNDKPEFKVLVACWRQ